MKNVYIVLGGGGSGKSSLIRSLTGIYNRKAVNIRLTTGNEGFYVFVRSQQEDPSSSNTPSKMLNYIQNCNENNIIIALRVIGEWGLPDGIAYINAINNHPQCTIRGIAVMHYGAGAPLSLPVPASIITDVAHANTNPINVNASLVRPAWGWI